VLLDKTEESLTKYLRVVQKMADEYGISRASPKKLTKDFKMAIINLLKAFFTNAESVASSIQVNNYAGEFKKNDYCRSWIPMILR